MLSECFVMEMGVSFVGGWVVFLLMLFLSQGLYTYLLLMGLALALGGGCGKDISPGSRSGSRAFVLPVT